MPSFASLLALAAPMMVMGAPLKRDTATNLVVLKFAEVLEQFESQFYSQALSKFQTSDFTSAGFSSAQLPIEQFTAIQLDEASHQTTLDSVIQSLADSPISGCQFNFGNALNDVPTMAATARVVENLGVGAYLGAAHLIDDPVLLTAAASIVTIEARHQTILNVLNNGASIPQAFDIPLLPTEVLAIAGAFITNCDLGVGTANQPLTITNTGAAQPGTSLTFSSPAINGSTDGFYCQMLVGGMPTSISLPFDQCVVPQGVEGPVAIFITADNQPLDNNVRDRANQKVVAGPTMTFIDTQKQQLSQAALSSSGSSNNSANDGSSSTASTTTISPAEATSIIASASSAGGSISTGAAVSVATGAVSAGTDSAAAASATDSAAATAASSAAVSSSTGAATVNSSAAPESDQTVVDSPGTRNVATGTMDNGAITIVGWNDLQNSTSTNTTTSN